MDGEPNARMIVRDASAAIGRLSAAVSAGEVRLDPETGELLRAALRAQQDDAADWIDRAKRLSRPVPLGRNPVGTAMRDKFENRADGDEVSLVLALEHYRVVVASALTAVDTAIRGYLDHDDETATRLRRIAGPEGTA